MLHACTNPYCEGSWPCPDPAECPWVALHPGDYKRGVADNDWGCGTVYDEDDPARSQEASGHAKYCDPCVRGLALVCRTVRTANAAALSAAAKSHRG